MGVSSGVVVIGKVSCSRVAGPFFSLPQHHRPLFKGCWSVLFTCPQQPSAAVWRRSKVQPWGAALHLGTKCNCLGAADGRPSLDEQMEICGKTYVPNIYIYIYIPTSVQLERVAPTACNYIHHQQQPCRSGPSWMLLE